jgi:hypothetical protein
VTSPTIGGGAVRFPVEAGGALEQIIEAPSLERRLKATSSAGDEDRSLSGDDQPYLRDFSRLVKERDGVAGIVSAMLELHGERDNLRVLWHSARAAVEKRG